MEAFYGALLESLPLVYSSLEEHQNQDEFCLKFQEELEEKRTSAESFRVLRACSAISPKGLKYVGG